MSRYGPNGGIMGINFDHSATTFQGGVFPLSRQQQIRGGGGSAEWPNSPFNCDWLVVGGGGSAAGSGYEGGGGGGGYRASTPEGPGGPSPSPEANIELVLGTPYPINIGLGGVRNVYPDAHGKPSTFGPIVSVGGGVGGGYPQSAPGGTPDGGGFPGGSGGGGGYSGTPTTLRAGTGTANQGYPGGATSPTGSNAGQGGGGGAGGAGGVNPRPIGGAGGIGLTSPLDLVGRGGGGAGGSGSPGTGTGAQATHGGGPGGQMSPGTPAAGTDGTAATGGGGGGAGGYNNAGHGGTGVVLFTAPAFATVTFTPGVTSTNVISTFGRTYTVTATSSTAQTFTVT